MYCSEKCKREVDLVRSRKYIRKHPDKGHKTTERDFENARRAVDGLSDYDRKGLRLLIGSATKVPIERLWED
jgi:hypothetical protein